MIRITLHIKSRAFGVTFGTFERVVEVQLPFDERSIPRVPFSKVLLDERGVYLKIEA